MGPLMVLACFPAIGAMFMGLWTVSLWLGYAESDSGSGQPFLITLGLGVVTLVLIAIDTATPGGQRRHEQWEAEKEARDKQWKAQLGAWGYDPQGTPAGRWPPRGFRTYEVKPGSSVEGQPIPAWNKMHLQLAPPGRPDLAIRMARYEPGPPVDIPVHDLLRLQAPSRSGTWFGIGASGSAAAHVASALDYHLAGYELHLLTRSGLNLRLRMLGGAPPEAELSTIEARMAGVPY